jgi:hypothetical protein
MRLVIADQTLRSICEDPAEGVAVLGEAAFASLSLVLDVLSPPTVNLASLRGLRSMSVRVDPGRASRVVITTNYVRVAFAPLIHTSTGELTMATDNNNSRRTPDALQLVEVVALPDVREVQDGSRTMRRARP